MGWRKSAVDFAIFIFIAVAVYFIVISNNNQWAIIFLIIALGITLFRRTIYDILS